MDIFVAGCLVGFSFGLVLMALTPLPEPEDQEITIGQKGSVCSVDINASVWAEMNKAGVYRWVVACEKTKEIK